MGKLSILNQTKENIDLKNVIPNMILESTEQFNTISSISNKLSDLINMIDNIYIVNYMNASKQLSHMSYESFVTPIKAKIIQAFGSISSFISNLGNTSKQFFNIFGQQNTKRIKLNSYISQFNRLNKNVDLVSLQEHQIYGYTRIDGMNLLKNLSTLADNVLTYKNDIIKVDQKSLQALGYTISDSTIVKSKTTIQPKVLIYNKDISYQDLIDLSKQSVSVMAKLDRIKMMQSQFNNNINNIISTPNKISRADVLMKDIKTLADDTNNTAKHCTQFVSLCQILKSHNNIMNIILTDAWENILNIYNNK